MHIITHIVRHGAHHQLFHALSSIMGLPREELENRSNFGRLADFCVHYQFYQLKYLRNFLYFMLFLAKFYIFIKLSHHSWWQNSNYFTKCLQKNFEGKGCVNMSKYQIIDATGTKKKQILLSNDVGDFRRVITTTSKCTPTHYYEFILWEDCH